jgi:peptidoglycan L-alanyl-D-glutamate endopeptidase CwlK
MPYFGKKSLKNLETCDEDIQALFKEVIKYFDCTVTEGHRKKSRQEQLFDEGKTKLHYPHSLHNSFPCQAVDVVPYPIDYNDRERITYFAGFVKGVAYKMGIPIRWGGDWNNNTEVKDNNFDDLPHFELESF